MRGSEGAMAFKCPALSKQILRDLPSKIIKPSQERSGAVFLFRAGIVAMMREQEYLGEAG